MGTRDLCQKLKHWSNYTIRVCRPHAYVSFRLYEKTTQINIIHQTNLNEICCSDAIFLSGFLSAHWQAFRADLCRFKIKVNTSKVLRSLSWTCRPMCCVLPPEDARALPVHLVHAPILWWSPGCSFTFLCVFFRFLFVLCCFCLRFLASGLSLDFWVLNISLTVVSLKFIFKIEDK